jgi:Protein of Unknown function (DUF2784)
MCGYQRALHKTLGHKDRVCAKMRRNFQINPAPGGLSRHQPLRSREGYAEKFLYNQELGGTMEEGVPYLIAADLILFVHVLFVAFVVLGLVFILVGKLLSWSWVRNPWFRSAHLAAIGVVVLQSWLGVICPLTTWEMALREKADDAIYSGSFVSHWLETILYYRAPQWVFVVGYTVFGALVAVSWYWVRPRRFVGAGAHGAA